ncbi:MAG: hypothetical protein AAFR58_05995 [Cyanobacteria bacterium J06627_28]
MGQVERVLEVQVEEGLVEEGLVELRLLDLKQIERVLKRVLLLPVVEVARYFPLPEQSKARVFALGLLRLWWL